MTDSPKPPGPAGAPPRECGNADGPYLGSGFGNARCRRPAGHSGNHVNDKEYTRHEWAQIPERAEPAPAAGPAGTPCPVCGHAWHLHIPKGCTAAYCHCTEKVDGSLVRCRDLFQPCLSPHEACAAGGCIRTRFAPAPAAPVESAPFIASRGEIGAPDKSADILKRLDLEIEWFQRLIDEDGARGCNVESFQSLLHKLRQVRGDIPSTPPSRAEMDRFFADAAKESNHRPNRTEVVALLRRVHAALRATLQALPKSVKEYPPGAVEASVDAAMFLEALDAASKR